MAADIERGPLFRRCSALKGSQVMTSHNRAYALRHSCQFCDELFASQITIKLIEAELRVGVLGHSEQHFNKGHIDRAGSVA